MEGEEGFRWRNSRRDAKGAKEWRIGRIMDGRNGNVEHRTSNFER
jgi:hypothetical protein